MKKFLRRLMLVGLAVVMLLAYGLHKGWLTLSMVLPHHGPPPASPTPAPAVVLEPSPSPSPSPTPGPLRIGIDDERPGMLALQALPQFIASRGADVQVEMVPIADGRLRWQMLAAGRLDLACGTLDSFVLGATRQDAGPVILKIDASAGEDVLVAGREVKSLRQLKDKKVAVVAGSGGAFLLGYYLDGAHMSPSEAQVVETDDPRDAERLLASGKVQAAWLWEPEASRAIEQGGHVLERTSSSQTVLEEVCAASTRALAERRSDIMLFMRHWLSFVSLLESNPGLGHELVARYTHRSPATVDSLLGLVRYYDLASNQSVDDQDLATRMKGIQEFWKITGAANSGTRVDWTQEVKIDLTRDIDLQAPASVFGATPAPQESPSGNETPTPGETPTDGETGPGASSNPGGSPSSEASP